MPRSGNIFPSAENPTLKLDGVSSLKCCRFRIDDLGASFGNVPFVSYPIPDLVLASTGVFVL